MNGELLAGAITTQVNVLFQDLGWLFAIPIGLAAVGGIAWVISRIIGR